MKKNSIKLIIFDGYGVILSRGYPDTCRALAEKFKLPEKELLAIIYRILNWQRKEKLVKKLPGSCQ